MVELSGTAIFWFTAMGLAVGLIFGLIIEKEGIPLSGNIIWGVVASVSIGSIGIIFGLGDGLLFAFVYTLAFLFIVNVFHQHHVEDVFGHVDREVRINKVRKQKSGRAGS
jgi:hypothetical protein